MSRHEAHVLFPPPDHPFDEGNRFTIEIVGAAITRVQTMQEMRNVATTAHALHDGKTLAYRFLLPTHSRTVREFFKLAGVKWQGSLAPRTNQTYTVEEGAYLVALTGLAVGTDRIPEGLKSAPTAAYVLEEVKVRAIPLQTG